MARKHDLTTFEISHAHFIFLEFAEYTSAQERIALGKKSKKLEANKRRDNMKEMIADACVPI